MKIKKLYINAIIPERAHPDDAGVDLFALVACTIAIGERKFISTGISVAIPMACCGLIRPRSGIAKEHGITSISSGVIDEGYRGEILVGLVNLGEKPYRVKRGDRIAQLLIIPIFRPGIEVVDELPNSDRGVQGHGSTGR